MPGRRKKKGGNSQPAKPRARARAPERDPAQAPPASPAPAAPEPAPLSDLVRVGQRAIVAECLRRLKAGGLSPQDLYYIQRTLDGEARRGEPRGGGATKGWRVRIEVVEPEPSKPGG